MSKKYIVEASEVVLYQVEVEADTAEQAKEKVIGGEVELPEANDSNGFQIDDVYESTT